jgi:hypothetical protein
LAFLAQRLLFGPFTARAQKPLMTPIGHTVQFITLPETSLSRPYGY